MNKQGIGRKGEMIAAAYLAQHGYQVVARNYRAGRGEIDIITTKDDLLVFVEVKTRSSNQHGYPEEAVSKEKINMVNQTAQAYIEEHNWQKDIRFDILSIELDDPYTISHFEDAFSA